jgi:hypothetical protein
MPNRIEAMTQAGIHGERVALCHVPADSEPIAWELSGIGRRIPAGHWRCMARGDDCNAPMLCLGTIEVFEGIPVGLGDRK